MSVKTRAAVTACQEPLRGSLKVAGHKDSGGGTKWGDCVALEEAGVPSESHGCLDVREAELVRILYALPPSRASN